MKPPKMSRREWFMALGCLTLTGCGSCQDEYNWVQVPYAGKMYRVYSRKEKGVLEIRVYEENPSAPLGTNPWKEVAKKEEVLDMLPRNVVVDSGSGAALPDLERHSTREAVAISQPRIYVLDIYADDRVVALDGITLDRIGTVSLQQLSPVGLEISPDKKLLYVAIRAQSAIGTIPSRPAAIQILTTNPLALSRRIDLPSTIIPRLSNQSLVVSTDGSMLYLVNEGPFTPPVGYTNSTLVRIDLATGRITGEVGGLAAGRVYGTLARSADGRMLYSLASSSVAFIDLASFSLMTEIPITRTSDLVIHPDGSRVYVSSSNPPRVNVIDTISARIQSSISLGQSGEIEELEITPDGRYLFAHDDDTGSLHVVDLEREVKVGDFSVPPEVGRIGLG